MYNINTKNLKKGRREYFFVFLIGLIFFIGMLAIALNTYFKFKKLDSTTLSTKVEMEAYTDDEGKTSYSPVYYYVVDDIEYTCSVNVTSSLIKIKNNDSIYYDSKNPSKCLTKYEKSANYFLIIFLFLPLIFIILGFVNIRKFNKKLKQIKILNKKGKLVKNLPYHLEYTGESNNDTEILKPVLDYTLPTGETIRLEGDPRYDMISSDEDGFVDLIIDENNPKNYFIDFEINRLTGNLPDDYYNNNGDKSNKDNNSTN